MNTNNPLNPADFLEAPEVEDVSMTRARREYEELQENVISLSSYLQTHGAEIRTSELISCTLYS